MRGKARFCLKETKEFEILLGNLERTLNLKKQLNGLIRLTRYKEYPFFVIVTSLLGAAAANGVMGWKLVGVVTANLLTVAFAFMINDVEDAPDDAVYAFLGGWPLITGLSCLVIAYFYSWRRVRLKSRPIADLLSHGLMLAGLQFLSAYLTFEPVPFSRWIYPFMFVVGISLYGELFNELRDLKGDQEAGITHTANLIGYRAAYILMFALLLTGVGSAFVTVFVIHLIPLWVVLLWIAFAAVLVIPKMWRIRQHSSHVAMQESFHKPVEIAAACALSAQFLSPWALAFFSTSILQGLLSR